MVFHIVPEHRLNLDSFEVEVKAVPSLPPGSMPAGALVSGAGAGGPAHLGPGAGFAGVLSSRDGSRSRIRSQPPP